MQTDGRYRFDNYVVGSANRLAVAAARAVAEAPGAAYNPLFIYSSSGLGKTHLIGALAHQACQLQPNLSVAYLSLDDFVAQLHAAISAGEGDALKQRFQSVDLLLLDDVQFLTGQRETQSEMLRLFNALQGSGRQIVMASDRPPADIADVDERLITRLSGGLVVDIGAPDYETRVAILRNKTGERGAQFRQGVLEELATVPFANVRELQGALNRLIAFQGMGEQVAPESVREIVGAETVARAFTPHRATRVSGSMRAPTPGASHSAPRRTPPPAPTRTSTPPAPAARPGATPAHPLAASTAAASMGTGEFASFVSDIAVAVAQHVEPWKMRIAEAVAYWSGEGYRVAVLERALKLGRAPDVDGLLDTYAAAVEHLKTLETKAIAVDPALGGDALFRDPERVSDAEALVARAQSGDTPPPGPSSAYARHAYEVSPSNQLAVKAADAVAAEPGKRYNPLFIHGPSGTGKTHLVNAVGNEMVDASGGALVVSCVGAQDFVDELIAALQEGTVDRWRARYRAADALIIDDVHFVAGKERTQDELFHVFNALHDAGKQIILTSDRPPKELGELEERLRSRFEGGLVVGVHAPDRELREKLFARFLSDEGVVPTPDLLGYLAERPVSSVREVNGVVNRLVAAADVAGVELTLSLAKRELGDAGAGAAAPAAPPTAEMLRAPAGAESGDATPALDAFFLDGEKVVWDWPDVAGRAIEEWR
ncbi:MAG TPA: DnaA/Hda family protein [Gemmatimonadaceae bacterium]|nr:DnaA/Hda family protein [Gemmatimonadaceae bacterium]